MIRAQVARIHEGDKAFNTLVVPRTGFLAVRVEFHEEPVEELKVEFLELADRSSYDPGAPLAGQLKNAVPLGQPYFLTAFDGVAVLREAGPKEKKPEDRAPLRVPIGVYACRIEHQPLVVIPTVESPMNPFVVLLPVGRAAFDLNGNHEFDAGKDPW